MRKTIIIILFLLCVLSVYSLADSFDFRSTSVDEDEVVSSLEGAVGTWIFTFLPIFGFFCMSIAGLSLMFDKTEGKEKILYVVLGVGAACLGPAIIMFFVNIFKNLYTT